MADKRRNRLQTKINVSDMSATHRTPGLSPIAPTIPKFAPTIRLGRNQHNSFVLIRVRS